MVEADVQERPLGMVQSVSSSVMGTWEQTGTYTWNAVVAGQPRGCSVCLASLLLCLPLQPPCRPAPWRLNPSQAPASQEVPGGCRARVTQHQKDEGSVLLPQL